MERDGRGEKKRECSWSEQGRERKAKGVPEANAPYRWGTRWSVRISIAPANFLERETMRRILDDIALLCCAPLLPPSSLWSRSSLRRYRLPRLPRLRGHHLSYDPLYPRTAANRRAKRKVSSARPSLTVLVRISVIYNCDSLRNSTAVLNTQSHSVSRRQSAILPRTCVINVLFKK